MSAGEKPIDAQVEELLEELRRERAQRTQALGFELLPCPFCGGEPYVEYNDEFDMEYVGCDCGAAYAAGDLAGWNSRVDIDPKRKQ